MLKQKERKHKHGVVANSIETFQTFIGCTVVGVIRSVDRTTLVFSCGWGLTLRSTNGAYWTENPEVVTAIQERLRNQLAVSGVSSAL
jgi:hypothetical protein